MCAGQIEFDTIPTKSNKAKKCNAAREQVLFSLHELCVLNEFGIVTNEKGLYI